MTYLDVVIVAFIACWALLTLVGAAFKLLLFYLKADFPGIRILKPYHEKVLAWHRAITSWDVLGLLSTWNFFSNEGGWYDLYVYVRGVRRDCTFTDWKDVTPKGRAGAVKLSFPTKREFRAIRKIATVLVGEPGRGSLRPDEPDRESSPVDESGQLKSIVRLRPYQFLLRYIRLQPFDPAVEWCQFLIAASNEDAPVPFKGMTVPTDFTVPKRYVLLVSPFHKLNPHDASRSSSNTDRTTVVRRMREEMPVEKRAVASSMNERHAAVY